MVMADPYVRKVTGIEVIDGDTFRCIVDLGFFVYVKMSCRLVGINCNELNQPGGPEAKTYLWGIFTRATNVTVQSVRTDKFAGRFDAVVYVDGLNVNQEMIDANYAVAWNGVGTKPIVPWPPVSGTPSPS